MRPPKEHTLSYFLAHELKKFLLSKGWLEDEVGIFFDNFRPYSEYNDLHAYLITDLTDCIYDADYDAELILLIQRYLALGLRPDPIICWNNNAY